MSLLNPQFETEIWKGFQTLDYDSKKILPKAYFL
jgi:hypothetical protein